MLKANSLPLLVTRRQRPSREKVELPNVRSRIGNDLDHARCLGGLPSCPTKPKCGHASGYQPRCQPSSARLRHRNRRFQQSFDRHGEQPHNKHDHGYTGVGFGERIRDQFTGFPSDTESGSKLHSSCHFSSSRARGPKWHRFSLKTIFQRSICKYDAGSLRNGSNSYIRRPADCKFIKLELWKRASGRHPELIGDHHQFWRHERNHFASHTVRNGRHAKWSEPAPDAESWSDCDVDCEFRSAVVWQSEWKS